MADPAEAPGSWVSLFCCLHTRLHTNTHGLSEEQTDRSRTCWRLRTEIHTRMERRHSQAQTSSKTVGNLRCHFVAMLCVGFTCYLLSSSSTISPRFVLIQAHSSSGPLGTKDAYQALKQKGSSTRPRQTVAVKLALEDNSERRLQW